MSNRATAERLFEAINEGGEALRETLLETLDEKAAYRWPQSGEVI